MKLLFGHAHLDLGRARTMEAFPGSRQGHHSAGQCALVTEAKVSNVDVAVHSMKAFTHTLLTQSIRWAVSSAQAPVGPRRQNASVGIVIHGFDGNGVAGKYHNDWAECRLDHANGGVYAGTIPGDRGKSRS